MEIIAPGARGTAVLYLQLALRRAGYMTDMDGIFGESTCRILNAFLQMETDCVVSQEIWDRLIPYLKGYTRHRIMPGDSLYRIARRYRTQVEGIRLANPQINEAELEVGSVLNVPFAFPVVSTSVPYTSVLNEYVIEGLKVRYPFLTVSTIGRSVMEKPLYHVAIGTGKKQVFYNASFHANESITTPLLLKFVEEYAKAYAQGMALYKEDAKQLYEDYELHLVPMVNPDGVDLVNGFVTSGEYYEQARRIAADFPQIPFPSGWKANIDGVDLNLQFPASWERAKEIKFAQGYTKPAPRDYVGMAPLTAVESKAVYDFTMQQDFRLILAYHTQGRVIYWKYQNYNPENSRQIAEYFSSVSGYAVEETPAASGNAGYKDWFIMTYNRPGYTIEAGEGENPLPMSQFDRIYEENRGILLGGMTQI